MRSSIAWGALALATTLAGASSLLIPLPRHVVSSARLSNRSGMPLRIVLYRPDPVPATAPAAVICQPSNNPPGFGEPLALEFVADGFVVATFDWRGREPAENRQWVRTATPEVLGSDLDAAIAHVRSLPYVDHSRVVLAGHSIGATLVLEAAETDASIAAVAALGMEAELGASRPRNVLFATGLHDEIRSPRRMLQVLRVAAGPGAQEGRTEGRHEEGTARRLHVSPTADHFTEMLDRGIHAAVRQWFHDALGLRSADRVLLMEARALSSTVAWLGLVLVASATAAAAGRAGEWSRRLPPLLAAGAVVSGARAVPDVATGAVLAALAGGAAGRVPPAELGVVLKRGLRIALLLWASVEGTLLLNGIPSYAGRLDYLLALPEFLLKHPLAAAHAYVRLYPRPFLQASVVPLFLLAVEVALPGAVVMAGRRLSRDGGAHPGISPQAKLVVLGVLAGVLVALTSLRLAQGYVTRESLTEAAWLAGRYGAPPVAIFTLLRRIGRA